MSPSTTNPVLQWFWVESFIKHRRIVVTFHENSIERRNDGLQPVKHMPQIGQDSQPVSAIIHDECTPSTPSCGVRIVSTVTSPKCNDDPAV